jgi:hypothetical protein
MFPEIKSKVGDVVDRLRYGSPDDASSPDDVIDHSEWTHTAEPGLGERLKRKRRLLVLYGGLIAAGLIIASQWVGQILVGFATDPLVQTVASHGLVAGLAGYWGLKTFRARVGRWDWLVGMESEGLVVWLGEYDTVGDGTTVFTPFAGIDWLGFQSRPLQLRELGEQVAHTFAKTGRDADDPARVRLDDAVVRDADTFVGTIVAVHTDGFKPDPWGQHSDAYAQPPALADADGYRQLRQQLEQYVEDIVPAERREKEAIRMRNQELLAKLQKTGDDEVDEFIDRLREVEQARSADSRGSKGGGQGVQTGAAQSPPAYDPLTNGGGE